MATANLYLARIYSLPTGGTAQGDFRVNTNGTVAIRNGNVAIATSTPTLSAGTVYRAEWRTNVTSTTQELRIYTGESTSPYITLTGAWSTATARTWAFGPADAAATGAIDYDTIKIADDWTGPEVISNPTVTATVGDYSRIIASTTNGTAPFTYSIAQLTGTTTAPIDVSNGVWLVQRSATETLTYRITVTDATSTTDDYDISVLPVTAATAWPKKPTSVGTTSWA
jgi:hypothetical protein